MSVIQIQKGKAVTVWPKDAAEATFVWPGTAKDSKPDFSAARGFQTAHWSQGGMNHWVISDVNRQEFGAVVAAIQVADASR